MGFQRCKDDHLTFQSFHIVHLLNDDRNRPDPVRKNKEESVQKLKARIVRIHLTDLGKHDRNGGSSKIAIDLRVNSFIFCPHFYSFQSLPIILVFLNIVIIQIDRCSVPIDTSDFSVMNVNIDIIFHFPSIKKIRMFLQKTLFYPR